MREGDILLINYKYDIVGFLIKKFTHSNFNHVAWALDKKMLLEARSIKGITTTTLKKYKNKWLYKIKLVRLKNINRHQIIKAMNYAVLGDDTKGYGRFLLTLWLLFTGQIEKLSKKTCSGFIADALDYVGWKFRYDKDPLEISPEDMNNSKRVKNVSKEL